MATDKLPLGPHSSPKVSDASLKLPKEKGNMVCLTGRPQGAGQEQGGSGKGKDRALVPSNAGSGLSSSSSQGPPAARPESSGSLNRAIQLQHSTPVRQNPSGDFAR